jgi:hypothetical protein
MSAAFDVVQSLGKDQRRGDHFSAQRLDRQKLGFKEIINLTK